VSSVLVTLFKSAVLPSSKGISEGLLFGKAPTLSTVETRVYLQSCVYRSEGFLGKVFGWEGFGSFCVLFQ